MTQVSLTMYQLRLFKLLLKLGIVKSIAIGDTIITEIHTATDEALTYEATGTW